MTRIHIHEDDEGMRNVHPAAARGDVMKDVATAQAKSATNLAPDGMGWTDAHAIQEPTESFRTRGIALERVSAALGDVLPRIREFEIGFGAGNPFHHLDEDAHCFGFGQRMYLKLEADGEHLAAIWFDATSDDEEQLSALRRALEAIDAVCPSMIADYWLNSAGLIGDRGYLDRYFDALRQAAASPPVLSASKPAAKRGSWWAGLMRTLFRSRR